MPPQFPTRQIKPPPPSSAAAGAKRPPLLSPVKKIARPASAARPAPTPQPPSSAASRMAGPSRKPAARQGAAAAAARRRAAESVHPARRLACGTAVYVRTRYVMITERCRLLIWLPARVVAASDAYHCTIKYAADLHAMFAGKVARVPVSEVREAPSRPCSAAAANANANAIAGHRARGQPRRLASNMSQAAGEPEQEAGTAARLSR